VLRRISEQLRAILEKEDFIARIGGDEFASLVFADTRQIRRKSALLARQILHKLQIEVPAPIGMIRLGCTLGIATCPGDATDAEGLMALADRLLYVGKKDGRNQVVTSDQLATGRLARHTGA
jgi:diguanylate cyclase (GGDEF)-like protein